MNRTYTTTTPRSMFAALALVATLAVGSFVNGLSDYTVDHARQAADTARSAQV